MKRGAVVTRTTETIMTIIRLIETDGLCLGCDQSLVIEDLHHFWCFGCGAALELDQHNGRVLRRPVAGVRRQVRPGQGKTRRMSWAVQSVMTACLGKR